MLIKYTVKHLIKHLLQWPEVVWKHFKQVNPRHVRCKHITHTSVHTKRNHGSYVSMFSSCNRSKSKTHCRETRRRRRDVVGSSTTDPTRPLYVGTIQHIMDKFYHTSPSGELNGTRCFCSSVMRKRGGLGERISANGWQLMIDLAWSRLIPA